MIFDISYHKEAILSRSVSKYNADNFERNLAIATETADAIATETADAYLQQKSHAHTPKKSQFFSTARYNKVHTVMDSAMTITDIAVATGIIDAYLTVLSL